MFINIIQMAHIHYQITVALQAVGANTGALDVSLCAFSTSGKCKVICFNNPSFIVIALEELLLENTQALRY